MITSSIVDELISEPILLSVVVSIIGAVVGVFTELLGSSPIMSGPVVVELNVDIVVGGIVVGSCSVVDESVVGPISSQPP